MVLVTSFNSLNTLISKRNTPKEDTIGSMKVKKSYYLNVLCWYIKESELLLYNMIATSQSSPIMNCQSQLYNYCWALLSCYIHSFENIVTTRYCYL